jgi:hypothetical protein
MVTLTKENLAKLSKSDKQIADLFNLYFGIDTDPYVNIINGKISAVRHIKVKPEIHLHQLPIKFGTTLEFDVSNIGLTTLEGCPRVVKGTFRASINDLTNLKGGPEFVDEYYNIKHNMNLTSLEGLPDNTKNVLLNYNKDLPVLRLLTLKVNSLLTPRIDPDNDPNTKVENLTTMLKKYRTLIKKGDHIKSTMWSFQNELISAGFESNARW